MTTGLTDAQEACVHMNFKSVATVARLTDVEGGPVTGYTCDFKVNCVDCGAPFSFKTQAPLGGDWDGITTSLDRTELRCGIQPGGQKAASGAKLSYRIKSDEKGGRA